MEIQTNKVLLTTLSSNVRLVFFFEGGEVLPFTLSKY